MIVEERSKVHIVQLVTAELCCSVAYDDLSDDRWVNAEVYRSGSSGREDARRCAVIYENNSPASLAALFSGIREGVAPLLERNGTLVFGLSTLQLIRYHPGNRFTAHRDAERGSADWRRYSFVCYLNADFDDGETAFPDLGIVAKPSVGHAVLFPSHYLHEGREVRSGTKYVVNGFLIDPTVKE